MNDDNTTMPIAEALVTISTKCPKPHYLDTHFQSVHCKCCNQPDIDICIARMMPWKIMCSDTHVVQSYFINFDYNIDYKLDTSNNLGDWVSSSVEVDEKEYRRLTEVLHDFQDHPEKYIKEKQS